MNSAIQFKLQPCIYVQSACTTVDSAAAALGVCRKNDKEALRFVCSLLFSLLLFIATPFFFLFYSSLHPCALILLDNIKIAPAREKKRISNPPPRPKKERGCCPSSAPGQLASQQQRRQVYIYTSTKASAEPCRACQVERSSSTYRCVEVKCVFSYSSFLSSES